LGNVEGAVTTGELAGPAAETWAVAVADDAGGATAGAAAEDECAGGATAGAAAEDEGAGAVTAGAAAEDEGAEGVTVGRSRGRWIHGHRRRHRWSRGSGTGHALAGGGAVRPHVLGQRWAGPYQSLVGEPGMQVNGAW
jgi:hypothetical protein